MEKGSQRQVALEIFEGFFDLGQLDVKVPQLGRLLLSQIGAQQVAAFAAPHLAPERVRTLFAEHRAGRANHARKLWPVLMAEMWAERWKVTW